MNIVIDQGNASAKVALFDKDKLMVSFIYKPLRKEQMEKILNQYSPRYGILSAVADVPSAVTDLLKKRLERFIELDGQVSLPVEVMYRTPETLGKDRLAAVVGAQSIHPRCNILVIDAGTALTYEFLDASGKYWGGNISPGMTTRFKSLKSATKRLPLLDEQGSIPEIGYDTETAIRTGVVKGMIYEMDAYITEYKLKYPGLFVFLTGGHSFYFETKLK
ncbi:MAG: type III pantothenate kinase, partial [Dysgonamonadaceae bacterium]|nr:type III pantothenate kinase [Dysgonamonadaceae bacterium]